MWQVTVESKGQKGPRRWSCLSERRPVQIGERSQGCLNYVYRFLAETLALANCSLGSGVRS